MKRPYKIIALNFLCGTAFALGHNTTAQPSTQHPAPSPDQTGIYMGVGGSYNIIRDSLGTSTTNMSADFATLLTNTAIGSIISSPTVVTNQTFAVSGQMGYFQHFSSSAWLWGAKMVYQYQCVNNEKTAAQQTTSTLTYGTNPIYSTEDTITQDIAVNHEIAVMPYIGLSFTHGLTYLGVGPAFINVSQITRSGPLTISQSAPLVPGTTLIGTDPTTVTLANQSDWLWSGAVQIGASYYLTPTWFVDGNYMWAFSGRTNFSIDPAVILTTVSTIGATSATNSTSQQVTIMSFGVSINKVFAV
ncbi:MAG: hypothetical protein A3J38_08375 [Gammaproteobacteria bacterium RIFCSPHIGHO2_12_FULL_45_9]|nr:MAG: hypothetical protein A3J38_08375 [Gammaproteobacteria bacterium RIFCSPHIGHO2_12_FULL_45_9]